MKKIVHYWQVFGEYHKRKWWISWADARSMQSLGLGQLFYYIPAVITIFIFIVTLNILFFTWYKNSIWLVPTSLQYKKSFKFFFLLHHSQPVTNFTTICAIARNNFFFSQLIASIFRISWSRMRLRIYLLHNLELNQFSNYFKNDKLHFKNVNNTRRRWL